MEWQNLTVRPEYLALKMQVRDIAYAFSVEKKESKLDFIYNVLIANGLLQKYNERYYMPTDKLLEFAFVPSFYITTKEQRRALVFQTHFTKEDLMTIFGGSLRGLIMFRAMVRNGYVRLDDGKRYRIDATLGERLADGVEVIPITRVWETKEVEADGPTEVDYVDTEAVQEEATERTGLLSGGVD